MKTYIALLRGINVGGKNILPMKDLKKLLGNLGLSHVQTYIQSGNVVFQTENTNAAQLANQIKSTIGEEFGFEPAILLLTKAQFLEGLTQNPFPEAETDPKTLHLFFLSTSPSEVNVEKLNVLKKDSERFTLKDEILYLHAPEGVGRSKLAAQAEKALGVPATARNWRTCLNLKEMLEKS